MKLFAFILNVAWFAESDLNPAQDTCFNLQWSNMPVTEIGPSLVKVNTMGLLNSWSDEMSVHVVLMAV